MSFNESVVQTRVRLAASRLGMVLWRNNTGAAVDKNGRVIRYGLANDSKAVSSSFKSSDLIGITPVEVTQDMVGTVLGVFTALEVKKSGWIYRGNAREKAQKHFIDLVKAYGGIAKFINDEKNLT